LVPSNHQNAKKPDPIAEVELQIRRTANGNYFISDHADIDIIVMKVKTKF
jgi:hypothetical protein